MIDRERCAPRSRRARSVVARRQLDDLDRVGQPAEDRAAATPSSSSQPARPVDGQRQLAAAQRERLQHPGQPEEVVGVEVRQEDLVQVDEADVGAQQLALRALAAVEQQAVAAAPHERRRRRALCRRHRAGRPEEDDVEVHGAGV